MSDVTQQSFLNKAREDKFLLVFDVPPILKPSISDYTRSNKTFDPNSVQFSIFGTMVPQITVKGVETRFSGSTLYISSFSKDSPEPVSIDFKVDSMFSNYWVIYSWLNLLHGRLQASTLFHQSFDTNCNHPRSEKVMINVYLCF